jgi:hypothetical protein
MSFRSECMNHYVNPGDPGSEYSLLSPLASPFAQPVASLYVAVEGIEDHARAYC